MIFTKETIEQWLNTLSSAIDGRNIYTDFYFCMECEKEYSYSWDEEQVNVCTDDNHIKFIIEERFENCEITGAIKILKHLLKGVEN